MWQQRTKRRLEALLAKARRPLFSRISVLGYHSVHPSNGFASATPALFERHLAWLDEHCTLVPYGSIPDLIAAPRDDRPVVAGTFGDGYGDNQTEATPLLLERGIPATVFITTGLIDRDEAVVRRFAALWGTDAESIRGMSWRQVEEMRDAGVEIGAHTLTHPNLAELPEPEAFEEMKRSKDAIEARMGAPIEAFAYPFGRPRHHVSARTIDLAGRTGFRSAATILYRGVDPLDDPLAIPRFPVTGDPIEALAGKVDGAVDLIGLWQERSPMWLSRLVSSDPSRAATDPDNMAHRPRSS